MTETTNPILSSNLRNHTTTFRLHDHDLSRSISGLNHVINEHTLPQKINQLTELARQSGNKSYVDISKSDLNPADYRKACFYEQKIEEYKTASERNQQCISTLKNAIDTLGQPNNTRPNYDNLMQQEIEFLQWSRAASMMDITETTFPTTPPAAIGAGAGAPAAPAGAGGANPPAHPQDINTDQLMIADNMEIAARTNLHADIHQVLHDRYGGAVANAIVNPNPPGGGVVIIDWGAIDNRKFGTAQAPLLSGQSIQDFHDKTVDLINGKIVAKFKEFVGKLESHNEIFGKRINNIKNKKDELVRVSKSDITEALAQSKANLAFLNKEHRNNMMQGYQEDAKMFSMLDQLQGLWANAYK